VSRAPAVRRPAPDRPTPARRPGPSRQAPREPIDARTVRSALGLLREPFWARIAVAVVLLSVAFFFLGRWQLHRHQGKAARIDLINANYDATPVTLDRVLPTPASPLPADREWTQVRVDGVYETDHRILVRNRPLNTEYGFEVVVPLRLPSGAALLVDRGWIPAGERFVVPDSVPAPPGGTVSAVVRLRPGEPPLDRTPPPGQELRIDLGRMAASAGGTVYRGAYGVLAGETPAPAVAPTPLPRPDEDLGPHLAYAVQWWIGDVAAYVLLAYYALQEARDRRAGVVRGSKGRTAAAAAPPPDGTAAPAEPAAVDAARVDAARVEPTPAEAEPAPGPPRRRPGRWRLGGGHDGPTDEEWEDAAGG